MNTARMFHMMFQRLMAFLLCFALAIAFAPAPMASAQTSDNPTKVVKVGWLSNNTGFQEGEPGTYMSGWGYEYLQTLSYYTPAWRYEYVEGNFPELMDKLESGEIDLMPNISYTDERAKKLLYSSNPQGTERYYIYAKSDRDDLTTGNPSALTGLTIGANPAVMQTKIAQQWLKDEGVKCKYRYYDTSNELYDALANDKIDALIMNDTLSSDDAMPMFYVGETNYYLTVPKTRQDLMDDINAAMLAMQSANPRYNDEVKTHYSVSNGGATTLTSKERQWLAERGNVIKVGYLDRLLPYTNKASDGTMEGSLSMLTSSLTERFGIMVKTFAYDSNFDLKAALDNGDVDVIMPIYKDYWLAERDGNVQTSSVVSTSLVAVYDGGVLDDALKNIAYYPNSLLNMSVLEMRFPNSTIVDVDSAAAGVEAVKNGKAACVIIPVTALDTLRDETDLGTLKTAELNDGADLSCWMKHGNAELLSIMDKAIVNSGDKVAAAAYSHYSYSGNESGIVKFFAEYQTPILVAIGVFLAVIIAVLFWLLRRSRKAQAQAQAANSAKTAFLSRMSHDIRTPLNGIVGLIEVNQLHPDDLALTEQNRKKAKIAADHLLTLINDILEMSKIEDRDIVLENKPFNLVELFRDIYVLGEIRASERGVTINVDYSNSMEYPDVYGSPVHVRRIMLNLIDNCVKYNKPGGKIVCTAKTLQVEDGVVIYRFVIEDTGIGMSQEFLQHIFEPFAQESDDARSNFQGTGMGMPIVKGLVDKMGGSITVQSKKGVGSVFAVVLPFTIDEAPGSHEVEEAAPEDCSIEGMNILLAEDNDLNAEIAHMLLTNEGAHVYTVDNGKKAVETFVLKEEGSFDAILMDIMMPEMNGYEATRVIRRSAKRDALSIPIIAMSANAFIEDVRAAKESGMNDHVAKPIDLDILRSVLARYRRR